MLNKKFKEEKGFTLLELLITIFIIAVGLIGAYIAAQYPLSQISVSINRLTAAYLAQEGIEIVRNVRDTNWLEGQNWKNELLCDSCQADYTSTTISQSYNDEAFLKLEANGFYNNSSGSPTRFKREIEVEDAGDRVKVIVTVRWSEKGKDYSFDLQENLYNYWGD